MKLIKFLTCVALLTLHSCSQDELEDDSVLPKCIVTSIMDNGTFLHDTFQYDADGRVTNYESNREDIDYSFTYLVDEIVIEEAGKVTGRLKLDGSGNIVEVIRKNSTDNSFSTIASYQYDDSGKLKKKIDPINFVEESFTFDDAGNITNIKGTSYTGSTADEWEFNLTYDDKLNPLHTDALKSLFIYGAAGPAIQFYQSLSNNNVLTVKNTDINDYETYKYQYAFNPDGFPEFVGFSQLENSYSLTYIISYLCD